MIDRPNILAVAPLIPSLMDKLEAHYVVHRLWEKTDARDYLEGLVTPIVGIVTTGVHGVQTWLIDACRSLRAIAVFGVGLDAVDQVTARARGVAVFTTPNKLNACVADTALSLLLCVSRRVCEADRFVRSGGWAEGKFGLGRALSGKTCAVIGLGVIGREVAIRASAFGMTVVYQQRTKLADTTYRYIEHLVDAACLADFLVLCLPGGSQTNKIVNAEVLQALGPDGVLINVSRGSTVDENALIQALHDGTIAGAGLDVFADEPHVPAALLALPQVVLTPHIASSTVETRETMGRAAFDQLHAYLSLPKQFAAGPDIGRSDFWLV
jgi:lactate dehydrogenase-like 2-hydroxyacid dehydrogenase